jgi:F-type H+-transporting ATPase subunit b
LRFPLTSRRLLYSWASLLLASFLLFPAAFARAQNAAPAASSASASSATSDNPESGGENDEFRHAGPVRAIARFLHVRTETAAQVFEDINSAILIFVILFFALRALVKALQGRTATIQKQLIEARSATEIANERLSAVEAKLARLGDDIDAIRKQTERDLVEDEKRIKQALEEERARIVKSAEQEIESAGAAAQRELKRFAANLAIDRAAQRIQLTAETDKEIVERFGKDVVDRLGQFGGQFDKRERN